MIPLKYAAIGLLMTAGAVQAQSISASNPQDVMRQMQEAGFLTTMETDNVGDPKISSKVSESNFSVFFYGCNNGTECTTVQFSSGYDLSTATTTDRMNDWNRENRFGRAFIDDEGDPFIRMDVVLKGDGMGPQSFASQLEFWRLIVEEFEDFIDW